VAQDDVAQRSFAVIREAMAKEDLAGLARVVCLPARAAAVVAAARQGLLATALRYVNEVRDEKGIFRRTFSRHQGATRMLKLATVISSTPRGTFHREIRGPLRECLERLVRPSKRARPAPTVAEPKQSTSST